MRYQMGRMAVAAMLAGAAFPCAGAPAPPKARATAVPNWGPAMLGTTAVRIRADRFSGSWARALEDASTMPVLQQLIAPARRMPQTQQIAHVQRAVHARIRWISDATQWGKHDYWATAAQTLANGAGDMEDRAIVKMQALRALGFDQRDLFLTMGRDRVGGPLTVLVVRTGGRYLMLDDTGGAPFPAESRRFEFQPMLSFGWTGAWVHKRSAPTAPIAAFATSGAATRK